jgi:hypothetical protein
MLASIDDVHSPQRLWGLHGASYQPYGVASPRVRDADDEVVWRSFVVTQGGRMGVDDAESTAPEVPPGQTIADVIAERIRRHRATTGADLSGYTTEQITHLSQYNLFPNTTVLVQADMLAVLVARPGPSPDEAFFTMLTSWRHAPGAPWARIQEFEVPPETDLGLVMGQDCGLLRTAQRGLHQPGLTHLVIGSEECRIINFQRNLERFLGIEPSELVPIGS